MQYDKVTAQPINRNEGHLSTIKQHPVPSRPWAPLAMTGNRSQLRIDEFLKEADLGERPGCDRARVTGFVSFMRAYSRANHYLNAVVDLRSGVTGGQDTNAAMQFT